MQTAEEAAPAPVWHIRNPPAREPMSQQWEGAAFALLRAEQGLSTPLFMEPGTGKTKTTMMLAAELWLRGEIDALVVLAPNGVHRQWVLEEAPKDMPTNVPWRGFAWKRASSQAKHAQMAQIARPDPSSLLIVTFNYESAITEMGATTLEWLLRKHRCFFVIDECSRIRNPKAQRTKLALKLRDLAPFRGALSGTPNPKGYENLWAQLNFVDPTILDCPTFTAFKNAYCLLAPIPGVRFGTRIVGYHHVEELLAKIKPHIFTKRKADCLDLPGALPPITRKLAMTPEQRKAYRAMKEQHIVELDRLPPDEPHIVMVQRVIAARTKLRQLAIGFIIDGPDEDLDAVQNGQPLQRRRRQGEVHWITKHRLNRIVESLEDSDDKVILWNPFNAPKYELASLLEKAGISYMLDEDPGAQTLFNGSEHRVLLANPQRSGIGFNMANATRHIWVGPVDDEELRVQGRDRSYRIGQKIALTTENYAAPGTLEGGILDRGIEKGQMLELVMRRDWRTLLDPPEAGSAEDDDADWGSLNDEAANDGTLSPTEAAEALVRAGAVPANLAQQWLAEDNLKQLRNAVKKHLPDTFMSDM